MKSWRARLAQLYSDVLADLDARRATGAALAAVCPAPATTDLLVVAFGKAARPMAQAVLDHAPWRRLRGLVVPPEPDAAPLPPFAVQPGGHPLPTAGSVAAARTALELARSAGPADTVLFLVSGGGSAQLELPAGDVPLAELRQLYAALVTCGADIQGINAVRSACSLVKGGQLAAAAADAKARHTIALSDVPAGALWALASGPTLDAAEPRPTARAVLDRTALWPLVPAALAGRLREPAAAARPAALRPGVDQVVVALDGERALQALRRHAARLGLCVAPAQAGDELPYDRAAALCLQQLDRMRRRHPGRAVAVAAVGEVTVRVPPEAGVGGRNQQFALELARQARGRPIAVLSGGSDGVDGNSRAAGAVADGSTWARARRLGLDPAQALRQRNCAPLFAALGDALLPGPTGTNVRDLRLVVHGG